MTEQLSIFDVDTYSFEAAKADFWKELEETRDWVQCPCCQREARIYYRRLSSAMHTLTAMVRAVPVGDPVHVTQLKDTSGEQSRLEMYGFVEKVAVPPKSDLPLSGWWRITELGHRFLRGEISAPSHVRVYDGKRIGFAGDNVRISGVLGHPFDLEELIKESREME